MVQMQLHAVVKCVGLPSGRDNASWMPSTSNSEEYVSCETCIHWEDNRCNIDLFDEVLTSLDQT